MTGIAAWFAAAFPLYSNPAVPAAGPAPAVKESCNYAGSVIEQNVGEVLLGVLKGANFNVTTDQAIALLNNQTNGVPNNIRIRRITVTNASHTLATAVGGFYTGAGKTGTQIVANSQGYTALTGTLLAADLTIAASTLVLAGGATIYFALTTPEGAAATADIYLYGDVYA